MGKFLILSVADHEEHILNKIMEALADEPELGEYPKVCVNLQIDVR